MKRILIITFQLLALGLFSQTPQIINYQGVARDVSGEAIPNRTLSIRFEILQGGGSPTVVFTETTSVVTNPLGLFTTQIGLSNPNAIGSINFGSGGLSLRISIDENGGSSFVTLGTQSLTSVPYSMYAADVPATYTNNILTIGKSNFTLNTGATAVYTASTGISIISNSIILNTLPDQTVTIDPGNSNINVSGTYPNFTVASTPSLTINGSSLSISDGNTVVIPSAAAPSLTPQGAITLTSGVNSFTISAPAQVGQTLIPQGAVTVTNGANSFTISAPAQVAQTITPQGAVTVTSGVNSFTIGAPAAASPTIIPQGAVTLTSGVNSYTISAPAQVAQTITPQGGVTVTTGVNSFTIGAAAPAAQSITPQGILSVTTGVNSFTIGANTPTITPLGALTVTSGVNSFTIGAPALVTQSLVFLPPNTLSITGANTVSIPTTSITPSGVLNLSQVGNNYTLNVPQTTMTPTGGGVTITSPSTNSFVVDVPATTLTPGTNVSINGAHPSYTINSVPTLTLVGNNLSISGGNTIAIPSNTIVALTTTLQTGGIAQLTTFGANDYSVHVPNPTLSLSGSSLSINGGNTVVIPSAAAQTIVPQGAVTVTSGVNSFTINSPAQVAQTITPQGAVTVTTGVNSFTIGSAAAAAQTIVPQGAVTVTSGVNSFTVSAPAQVAQTITPQGAVTVTAGVNSFTIGAPSSAAQTIIPQGAVTVTSGVNSFTVSAPAQVAQTITPQGAVTVTSGVNSFTIGAPSAAAQTITPQGIVTVTSGVNSFTVGAPAQSITPQGAVTVTTGVNSFTIGAPAATAQTIVPQGAVTVTSGANSFTVSAPAQVSQTITPQGAVTVTTGVNSFTIGAPAATAQTIIPQGIVTVTSGVNSFTVGAAAQTIVPQGAVTVTNGANSFTVSAPAQVTQTLVPQGAVTVTTGVNSFTIGAPAATAQTIIPQGIVNVTTGVNSFTVGAPAQTIVPQGAVTVTNGANSFTVSAPAQVTQTLVPQGAVTVTTGVNSFTIGAPAATAQTIIPQGIVNVTTGVNSFTVGAPAQTIVPQGAVTVTNGANSFTVSAPAQVTQTLVPQGAVTITTGVNSFTIGAPAATAQTIIPQGIVNVTTGVNSFTVGAPAQTIVPQGAVTVTNGANSFTVSAPAQVTQTLVPQGAVTVTTGVNSFTIGAPAATAQTIIPQGIVNVTTGVNSFTVGAPAQTIVPQGAVTVTNGANSFTVSAPAQVAQTIVPQGAVTVTNGTNSFTINVPNATTPTIVPFGILTQTSSGSSFSLTVPPPTYTSSTGALFMGTSSVNITPTLSLSGNILTVGPSLNQIALPVTPSVFAAGVATVSAGPNYTVGVPQTTLQVSNSPGVVSISTISSNNFSLNIPPPITASITSSGILTQTTIGNSFSLSVPAPAAQTIVPQGAVTVTSGVNSFTIGAPAQVAQTITPSGAVTVTTGVNSFTVRAPAQVTQTIIPQGAVTVTTGVNSFTIGAPTAVTQTIIPQGIVTVTTGVNSFTVGAPAQTIVPQGAVTVTNGANSFTVSAPAQVAQTIVPQGAVTVTNGTNSFTINVPNAVTPTIVPMGILSQTAVGSSFTLNVPPPTYTASTGALFMGTSSVNITPTLSLSGNILTVGPSLNQIALPVTPSVFAAGIATVSPGPNYTVGVPGPSITPSGILTRTTSGNSFTLHVPAQTITPQGAVTLTTGVNSFTIGAPAAVTQTLIPQGAVTITSGVNSYTIGTPAQVAQTITPSGAVTVTTGVNSFTISAPAPTPTVNIIGTGAAIVTSATAANYTVNVPFTAITQSTGILVSGSSPNYTITSTPTLVLGGNNLSLVGGNTVVLPTTPTVSTAGGLTVSAGPNYTVGLPAITFTPATGILQVGSGTVITTPSLSLSGNVLTVGPSTNQVSLPTPTVFAAGIATVNPVGPSFTVGVPVPTYTATTGRLGMGTASVDITQALSLTGTTLTSGPPSNSINLANGTSALWSTLGNTGTSPATNFVGTTDNNALVFRTNNVERARVTQGGRFGIGTNSPGHDLTVESGSNTSLALVANTASVALINFGTTVDNSKGSIRYDNSTDAMNFWTNSVNSRMVINSAGNVGIGTNNPGANLEVAANPGYPIVSLTTTNTAAGTSPHIMMATGVYSNAGGSGTRNDAVWQMGIRTSAAGVTDPADRWFVGRSNVSSQDLVVNRAGNVGIGTTAPTQNLTVLNGMNIDAADANTGTFTNGLSFGTTSGEGIASKRTAGVNQFGLDFYTNTTGRMSITQAGNVGIGTNSPLVKFEVAPNSIVTTTAQGQSTFYQNGNVGGAIMAESNSSGNNSGGSLYARAYIASYQTSPITALNGDLGVNAYGNTWGGVFSGGTGFATPNTYAGLGGLTYAGVFMGGNVGIGNTAPTERLDVTGNLKFSGELKPNNLPGTSGQLLQSAGIGLPPTWVTSGLVAGGTTNYIPKWSSATGLSSTSQLYDNGTFVGVGTAAPDAKLTVEGTIDMGTNNLVTGFASGAIGSNHGVPGPRSYAFGTNGSVGNTGSMVFGDWAGATAISSTADNQLSARFDNGYRFFTDGALAPGSGVFISNSGNVGIGTANPNLYAGTGRYLSVSSTSVYTANMPAVLELQGSATAAVPVAKIDFSSLFTPGSPTNTARIAMVPPSPFTIFQGELAFSTHDGTSLTEAMRISKDGEVGIGTASPSRLFEVSPGTAGITDYQGHATFYHGGNYGSAVYAESNGNGNSTGGGVYTRAVLCGIQNFGQFASVNTGVWGNVTGGGANGWGVAASYGSTLTPTTYVGLANNTYAGIFMGGNVGIGIAAPANPLHVERNSSGVVAFFDNNTTTGGTCLNAQVTTANTGAGARYGIESTAANGTGVNYGIRATGTGGTNAYGVYGAGNNGSAFTIGVLGVASGGSGGIYGVYCSGAGGYTSSWGAISDQKFKENVQPMTGALDKILRLQPKTYTMKRNEYPFMNFAEGLQLGLIAQEVEQVIPELVLDGAHPGPENPETGEPGEPVKYKGMNYIGLTPVLVQAIKEQQQQIEDLKKVVAEQQKQIDQLLKK